MGLDTGKIITGIHLCPMWEDISLSIHLSDYLSFLETHMIPQLLVCGFPGSSYSKVRSIIMFGKLLRKDYS